MEITYEEFSKLTEDEVKAMFEEKGLTDSMHNSQNEKTDSKEAFCLDLTYEFENGLVYIANQDRSSGKIADNGVKQYEYKGRIFVEEQDSGTDGKIYIGYYPTDMGGLGYRAIFDKDTDINEIMDTIIALEL